MRKTLDKARDFLYNIHLEFHVLGYIMHSSDTLLLFGISYPYIEQQGNCPPKGPTARGLGCFVQGLTDKLLRASPAYVHLSCSNPQSGALERPTTSMDVCSSSLIVSRLSSGGTASESLRRTQG